LPTVRLRRRILVPAFALADLLGVSLVEVYGALNRLRGRTGAKHNERADGEDAPLAKSRQVEPPDGAVRPLAGAHDDPQLW
jgi:hypothetical protein